MDLDSILFWVLKHPGVLKHPLANPNLDVQKQPFCHFPQKVENILCFLKVYTGLSRVGPNIGM